MTVSPVFVAAGFPMVSPVAMKHREQIMAMLREMTMQTKQLKLARRRDGDGLSGASAAVCGGGGNNDDGRRGLTLTGKG